MGIRALAALFLARMRAVLLLLSSGPGLVEAALELSKATIE